MDEVAKTSVMADSGDYDSAENEDSLEGEPPAQKTAPAPPRQDARGGTSSSPRVSKGVKLKEKGAKVKKVPPQAGSEARTVSIGASLGGKYESPLTVFLRGNSDVFAWEPSDLPAVTSEVIEHWLAVRPDARPVKQKVRWQAQERNDFIQQEAEKLKNVGLIREVLYTTWLANPVVVPKA